MESQLKKHLKFTNERVDNNIANKSITRIGQVINGQKHIEWGCKKCGNVWEATPAKVVNGNTGCPSCAYSNRSLQYQWNNSTFDGKLKDINSPIVRLGDVQKGSSKVKVQCTKCNHVWFNTPVNIVTVGTGCPKCQRIEGGKKRKHTREYVRGEGLKRSILLIGPYDNMLTKTMWECENTHTWLARPNDVINNRSSCPHCRPNLYSKKAIIWLENIAKNEGIYIQHAKNEGEFIIPGTRLRADGYCKETNTVYEFHGDCWHGNPLIYQPTELCHPYSDKTAQELYENTIQRENIITSAGFVLVVRWETE